ncbi:Protein SDE2-like protein [Operophtera brumata]|uniref:Protein SDE2-like protein n=1 Tax=Operophtera brumata TaxID=104452 RepID=A0A0L7L410_OPEBR|nr:Protein SDE2-like protein [Operophtera brumata]
MPFVYFEQKFLTDAVYTDVSSLMCFISQKYGVPVEELYTTIDGAKVSDDLQLAELDKVVRVSSRLVGGKGGFGSMLRAIGAQIEKTTNREACRDLSGRRLRDINEEKRLRKWLDGQEERDREAIERKQKKLERLLAEPKIDVNLTPAYEKERKELPERISSAVDAGWEAAGTSDVGTKRKIVDNKKGKKKAKLWIDADLSDCSSSTEDEDEEGAVKKGTAVSTDSGTESDKASETSRTWCFVFLALIVVTAARPQEFDDEDEGSYAGDRKDDVARVQIKVYRGPTKHDGYAPWGFWVKQPTDD